MTISIETESGLIKCTEPAKNCCASVAKFRSEIAKKGMCLLNNSRPMAVVSGRASTTSKPLIFWSATDSSYELNVTIFLLNFRMFTFSFLADW